MDASEVQRLRTAAERAFTAGHHQQALAHSIRLERAQPDVPAWPRYTALVCQAMGRTLDQIDALERAAERHEKRGEILKAAAACKQILALDAEHGATRERLRQLRAAHRAKPAPVEARGPQPRIPSQVWREAPRGGLQELPLRQVMPGAHQAPGEGRAGVYAIPLEEEVEGSLSVLLDEARTSTLPSGARAPNVVPTAPPSFGGASLAAEDAAVLAVAEELRAAQRTEQALTDTPLFQDMPEAAFHDLLDRARLTRVARDRDVFRQGAPGDALFVIAEGEVGVIDEGPPRRGLCKLGEGDFFGEMALVADQPRTATCTALTDAELIVIDRETLQGVLQAHPAVLTVLLRFFRDRSVDRVLHTSPLFSCLSARDRETVRPFFRFLEVDPGSRLIEAGGRPPGLLVLLAGKAEAIRGDARLGVLVPGDMAGEMSLVTGAPANATVRAIDKVLAVEFPAPALQKILRARPEARAYVERVARSRSEGG
jgi:CRP-like cAMP-binding protein